MLEWTINPNNLFATPWKSSTKQRRGKQIVLINYAYLEPLDHPGWISQANTATEGSSGTVLGVNHLDPFHFVLVLVAGFVVHWAPVASGFIVVVATKEAGSETSTCDPARVVFFFIISAKRRSKNNSKTYFKVMIFDDIFKVSNLPRFIVFTRIASIAKSASGWRRPLSLLTPSEFCYKPMITLRPR